MATTADFRNGLCLLFKDDLYTITQFQHVKPGKGPAFVRTKLRNVKTGRVIENTFTSGVKIDVARIERRPYQFLYMEGEDYVMMHTETYDQMNITRELINAPEFLKEGDAVEMVVHADTETPLYVELMPSVILSVTYTEPGLKGDTASSTATKSAELETGAKIMVPLFVEIGDRVRVSTADKAYLERVRE
ncbi:MAG: elongation factor P [Odoribacteraceae bacterium]|jgi:elongation factor P|nr:elongation factor P [Odoribacteraceae bacterium]